MQLPIIPDFDADSANEAHLRQDSLTKPQGSLGRLEALSIQLAGITGNIRPSFPRKAVIVMAGDHGVTQEGVSAYPASVTTQMVLNFLRGGAAINVLARQAGARLIVVDIGVAGEFKESRATRQDLSGAGHEHDGLPNLLQRKIAPGTQNMCKGPAMTRQQAEDSIQIGIDVVAAEISRGLDLVATGEMGIGNTTPSSAMTAVFTGSPAAQVTGRGTGLDDGGLKHKVDIIEQSLAVNRPDPRDPLDVLSRVGGFEIGGLAGVMLGAAAQRKPVVVDGFISGAAALLACELAPQVKPFLIASHLSVENGHRVLLETIGLQPLMDLGLRLGEGTGAVLAFHLIEAAVRILNEMATFSEAGVDEESR